MNAPTRKLTRVSKPSAKVKQNLHNHGSKKQQRKLMALPRQNSQQKRRQPKSCLSSPSMQNRGRLISCLTAQQFSQRFWHHHKKEPLRQIPHRPPFNFRPPEPKNNCDGSLYKIFGGKDHTSIRPFSHQHSWSQSTKPFFRFPRWRPQISRQTCCSIFKWRIIPKSRQ